MGGLVPLSDASRRPARIPVVTVFIILVNAFVFVLELMKGEAFVTQWSAIPAQITSGHHWITGSEPDHQWGYPANAVVGGAQGRSRPCIIHNRQGSMIRHISDDVRPTAMHEHGREDRSGPCP
jgi:hypothetical protein